MSQHSSASSILTPLKPKRIEPAGKVVRDSVHGLIRIEPGDEVVLDLINTREFQRLRRIRQLGVTYLTYPGAEHSRFTHSLGVFNFAQRMLGFLEHRYADSTAAELIRENGQLVKVAALLHDLGHAPFSHLMERAFGPQGHHEERTVEIIRSSAIRQVLEANAISADAVVDIIAGTSRYRLLIDMVSSQLDADRMDYILRDALMTGVKYGSYDSEWLLNCLVIGSEPQSQNRLDPQNWRLCLDTKRGKHSAEQLIISRMHMSLQVYFHKATRGWEAHLLCLFSEAARLAASGELPPSTPVAVEQFFRHKGKLATSEFLAFDESNLFAAMHLWSDSTSAAAKLLAELSSAFLGREKCYCVREMPALNFEKSTRLDQELQKIGERNRLWLMDQIDFRSYKDFTSVFRHGSQAAEDERSTAAILMADGTLGGVARPIEVDSDLFQVMGQNKTISVARLYCHRDIWEQVKKIC